MFKKFLIAILVLLVIGGTAVIFLVPEEKLNEIEDTVKSSVNLNIKITPVSLLEKQLKQLSRGEFKEAQEHVNLNLAADLDDDYKEIYRKLYSKVSFETISENFEEGTAIVKFRYPSVIDLINLHGEDNDMVEKMNIDIQSDKLTYFEEEIELKMVNEHLVYTPELFRVLILLKANY